MASISRAVVDRQLVDVQATPRTRRGIDDVGGRGTVRSAILFFLYAAVLTLGLQIKDGAFLAELCTVYPDEAPHYVNGLLIANYVSEELGQPPLAFAKTFFLHFPKVSIGHWPPFFYLLEAGWMLIVSQSKTSVLIFSGLISAVLAALIGSLTSRRSGTVAALLAISFYVFTPLVRQNASAIMVDIFTGLLELAGSLAFMRYIVRPNWKWSAAFGLLASAAILSKGNGLALALLPPLAIIFMGRIPLVRRPDFWLSVPIVAILCGPWYVVTYNLARDGWVYESGLHYAIASLKANTNACLTMLGVAGCLVAGYGFVCSFCDRYDARETMLVRCLAALVVAILIFQMTVPSGLDPRYALGLLPPMIILAALGTRELSDDLASLLGRRHSRRTVASISMVLGLLLIAPKINDFLSVPQKPTVGMKEAANIVAADPTNSNRTVLISSDAIGEGAFVVEMAQHMDQGGRYVIARASKLLASANFLMEDYVARFQGADDVGREVERLAIRFVVIDTSKGGFRFKHSQDLLAAARANRWSLVGQIPHQRYEGETLVYDLKPQHVPSGGQQAAIGCFWTRPMSSSSTASPLQLKKPLDSCS
jgi:hypothetical protein